MSTRNRDAVTYQFADVSVDLERVVVTRNGVAVDLPYTSLVDVISTGLR